jgi:hypothetical protein
LLERLCRGAIASLAICLALSASADTQCPTTDADAKGAELAGDASSDCEAPHAWTSSRLFGSRGDGVQPDSIHPFRGLRAMAHPFKALALWAQGQGFHLSRRSALYDLQGGAAISLDEHVRFTASYRLSGVDLGFDSDVESADVEPSIQATFVGLSFDF